MYWGGSMILRFLKRLFKRKWNAERIYQYFPIRTKQEKAWEKPALYSFQPQPAFSSLSITSRTDKNFKHLSAKYIYPIDTIKVCLSNKLRLLQTIVEYPLSPEQSFAAKQSMIELAQEGRISILELVYAWEDTPLLGEFARRLRRVCLP